MDLYKFEEKFFSLFEVTPRHEVHGSVHFKTLEEWDSMMALETIAMVDEEFDVELNGDYRCFLRYWKKCGCGVLPNGCQTHHNR